MKIFIGADHRGFELKSFLIQQFKDHTWVDCGTDSDARVDYPLFADRVTTRMLQHKDSRGILICGSGIGMTIAANRVMGIYAALCWNKHVAHVARVDDGSNLLVIPSDFVTHEQATDMVTAWLSATFKGGRYQDRLDMIDR